jgi:23S rRNA (cytosine1962-C5)-methyltransferase
VYAAAGGATQIDSVDLSKTYLNWAEANMQLNLPADAGAGVTTAAADTTGAGAATASGAAAKCRFIHADVKQWLDEIPAGVYDLVVMDPPTFSNSKRMKDFLDIQRDHAELINKTLRAMRPGGILYFSTNYRKFQLETEKLAAASVKDITKATTPFDFQGKLFRYCFKLIKGPGR